MTSPIDRLRNGIRNGSWEDVCEGFRLLTGEELPPPARSGADAVVERIRALLDDHFGEPDEGRPEPDTRITERPAEKRPRMEWEEEDAADADAGPEPVAEELAAPAEPEPATPAPQAPVEANARQAAQASGRVRDLPDFSIEHKGQAGPDDDPDKGKSCRVLPMDTKPGKNRFVDRGTVAADAIAESRKLSKTFQGKDHRAPYKPVKVTCSRCNKQEEVHPDNAPKRLDAKDQAANYICQRCIGKPSR